MFAPSTPPDRTTASRNGFAQVCSNTRIASELPGASSAAHSSTSSSEISASSWSTTPASLRCVVVDAEFVELDEGDVAVQVLLDEQTVDDADRVVLDEPFEFGNDLAGELTAREFDDQNFDRA